MNPGMKFLHFQGMVSFVKNGDDPDGPWRETFLALNEELDRWDDYQRRLEEWYKAKEVHDLWYMTKLEECTAVSRTSVAGDRDEGDELTPNLATVHTCRVTGGGRTCTTCG